MQEKLNRFWSKIGWFFGFNVIFLLSDAFSTYKCYTYSESYGSKEHSGNLISVSWVEIKTPGILSSLRTQTGPWSDTFSYALLTLGKTLWKQPIFTPDTYTFNPNTKAGVKYLEVLGKLFWCFIKLICVWFFELNYGHMNQDLRTFVAKTHQSRFMRFWGKILNSNFCLCKKIDIIKLCLNAGPL